MATALQLTGGLEVEETAKLASYVGKFFNCLNGNNFTSGGYHRKPFQMPYRSTDDFRMKVYYASLQE